MWTSTIWICWMKLKMTISTTLSRPSTDGHTRHLRRSSKTCIRTRMRQLSDSSIIRDRRISFGVSFGCCDPAGQGENDFERIWCFESSVSIRAAFCRILTMSVFARAAGNAAYILGTIAETPPGHARVVSLATGPEGGRLLHDLTHLFSNDDPETVMNAVGTLGTLVGLEMISRRTFCYV